jgi:hypothetical protein
VGFEADLVRWVESFMEERKVIMSMDGKEGDGMDVETGVPQGSPASPVLFVIQVTVAASPPFGGTEIDHPRNTLPLAVKCLEGTKSWAHFQI